MVMGLLRFALCNCAALGAIVGEQLILVNAPPRMPVRILSIEAGDKEPKELFRLCDLSVPSRAGSTILTYPSMKMLLVNCLADPAKVAAFWMDGPEIVSRTIDFTAGNVPGTFLGVSAVLDIPNQGLAVDSIAMDLPGKAPEILPLRAPLRAYTAPLSAVGAIAIRVSDPSEMIHRVRHGSHGGENGPSSSDVDMIRVSSNRVAEMSVGRPSADGTYSGSGSFESLGIPVPETIVSVAKGPADGTLFVRNKHGLAMVFDQHRQNESPLTQISAYDTHGKSWRKLLIEGNHPMIRGFGEWLAVTACDTGRAKTNKGIPIDLSGSQTDWLVNGAEFYPGSVILWNMQSDTRISLQTDVSDTEVLDIHDNRVYYRVNDELLVATVSGDKLTNTKRLAKGESYYDIHFAFAR